MTDLSNEAIVDEFLDHIRYFSIVHHLPGRIRIKASWTNARDLRKIDQGQLEAAINRVPGILSYRVNAKALSAVIEYDQDIIPYGLWNDVGSVENYPLKREDVRERLLQLLQ